MYDLVDFEIRECIEKNIIKVDPYDPKLINPNSLDVRLGYDFFVCEKCEHVYNIKTDIQNGSRITLDTPDDYIIIKQGDFILGTTLETITLSSCIHAQLEGKSSIARWGIETHQTGGYIDSGFSGEITLELTSVYPDPIKLFPEMPIGQLIFTMNNPCKIPYNEKTSSKYNNQSGATLSKYHENFI